MRAAGAEHAAVASVGPLQEADDQKSECDDHGHDQPRAGVDDGGGDHAGDPREGSGSNDDGDGEGDLTHQISGSLNLWLDRPALSVRSPITMPVQTREGRPPTGPQAG